MLGSVVSRTNAAGAVVAQYDYQPWGEQWQLAGIQGDRRYDGRAYDPGTGLHDYGVEAVGAGGKPVAADAAGRTDGSR